MGRTVGPSWWKAGGQGWLVWTDQLVWHYGEVPSYRCGSFGKEQEELVQINQLVKPDIIDWFEV